MIKLMLERKTTRFPDYLWFSGVVRVSISRDGEMRVKAEDRLASE